MTIANSQRGKRNRQRGAELQREAVNIFKAVGLYAINRDRGGAQHEKGDIEVEGMFFGCKRKTREAQYLYPEKEERGVIHRGDGKPAFITIPLVMYANLLEVFLKTRWTIKRRHNES